MSERPKLVRSSRSQLPSTDVGHTSKRGAIVPRILLLLGVAQQQGDDLNRLAETHVVGQADSRSRASLISLQATTDRATWYGRSSPSKALGRRACPRDPLAPHAGPRTSFSDLAFRHDLDLADAARSRTSVAVEGSGRAQTSAPSVPGGVGALEQTLHLAEHRRRVDRHPLPAPLHQRLLAARRSRLNSSGDRLCPPRATCQLEVRQRVQARSCDWLRTISSQSAVGVTDVQLQPQALTAVRNEARSERAPRRRTGTAPVRRSR